ncbi:MAG: c-type cytochrome [Candidatus Omnitrophica bacterium]|nr:c-type cytochrome [Candidatus Omnitrophota bacterium]
MVIVSLFIDCSSLGASQISSGQKPPVTEAIFSKGEKLYQKQCAVCHGAGGAGDGEAAYLLYPKPRDFTRGEFRLVSTTTMEATDEDLFKTISRGMPGSAMPPWEFLSEEERWSLVYYVRYLAELGKEKKEIDLEALIKIGQEPARTKEGLSRGRELFVKACAPCHGSQGKGDGRQKMQDSLGYPLKPRDLTSGLFKGSSSSEDLYDRMLAGIPGTPMPSYQGAFTEEQIWDLIHYVQSLSNPEVETRARLRRHTIIAKKIKGSLSLEPLSNQWKQAKPVFVALTPLWWRDERVEGVEVKAIHDGEKIAVHLSWADPTRDDTAAAVQSFSDGAALQFSMKKDPPFFGMGNKETAVHFWHWKAAWQEDEKEMAEEAMAKGLGTLTRQRPSAEKVQAKGVWHDGKWEVVFSRPLGSSEQGALQLNPGETISAAFAVWDGAKSDRNGQKMVSIWNELKLE